ncbi:MAG: hypothetical protein MHM6MM_004441 [Cercozoa sp. M6MM]
MDNQFLVYFADREAAQRGASDPDACIGGIDITAVTMLRKMDDNQFGFELRTDERDFGMRASSDQDRDTWIQKLQSQVLDRHPVKVQHSGWLEKEGGRIRTWKRRFCVVAAGHLFYFKKQEDFDRLNSNMYFSEPALVQAFCEVAQGVIPLNNGTKVTRSIGQYKGRAHCFFAQSEARGGRRLVCDAGTGAELETWFTAIEQCQLTMVDPLSG